LPSVCSSLEIKYILNHPHPFSAFYKLWTRKEALLKASGRGIVDDLTAIPSLDGVHTATLGGTIHADQQIVSFQACEETWLSMSSQAGKQISFHTIYPHDII
jgi:4'-phosphopantetheinyl transferase